MKPHIIVVGGGASGLMAAGSAAQSGARVTLLEKMPTLGRKLAITGKGRCNLTNIASIRDFVGHFGKNGKFLYQAFSRFFSKELLELFNSLGVETVTERGGRVFPVSSQALDVVDALAKWNRQHGVVIRTNHRVTALVHRHGKIQGVQTQSAEESTEPSLQVSCDAVVLATGGASYPGTGSTGDGYRLAESAGHTIIPIEPALTALETSGDVAKRLQGLSLKNVNVTVWIDGRKKEEAFGEMMFTHFGVSGPVILTLSHGIVQEIKHKRQAIISIDLKPALDYDKLDARLIRDMNAFGKKYYHNLLKELLPQKLIPVFIDHTEIESDKPVNQINAKERKRVLHLLKDFRLGVHKYRPLSEAIVTAGGVSLKEVNPRTLQSSLIQGLFFAGELLDLNADTGGYNLQAAFSTGWLAGRSASETSI